MPFGNSALRWGRAQCQVWAVGNLRVRADLSVPKKLPAAGHSVPALPGGLVDRECRVAVGSVGDGVVAAVGGGVDGDDVGAVGEVGASGDGEVPVVGAEGGDPAGLGGHVQPSYARVVGQDVRILADRVMAGDLPGVQVEGEQGGVAVAGYEREPAGGVQGEAVAVVAAGQRHPPGDGQGGRVDDGEGVAALHVGQDLPGAG